MIDFLQNVFFRLAPNIGVPARWFAEELPKQRAKKTGILQLEIVSHCWQYSHLLVYQLSSLVNYPPTKLSVKMTVFYAEEDKETVSLLAFFSQKTVTNVEWNWQALPKEKLFRRAIGRNIAAKSTDADWIWFADCDSVFYKGCLNGLANSLQGRNDVLVYPAIELTTELLAETDPLLTKNTASHELLDLNVKQFTAHKPERATGPLQITHGDIARAVGYCDAIKYYQQPMQRWRKTYEDSVFRWLLGSEGVAIDVPSVYRIRHVVKGRYKKNSMFTRVRQMIRKSDATYKKN